MPTRHAGDRVCRVLGENIRGFREQIHLTQEKLAELSGLDPTYISGIERGRRNPTIKIIARLSEALGVKTAVLVEGVEA